MKPESRKASLELGSGYLDEATENLTFDEFEWAFEEVGRGVFWILHALEDEFPSSAVLPPKGQFVEPATLRATAAGIGMPTKHTRVLRRIETLTDRVRRADDREVAFAVNAGRIEALVFEAWELHDEVSKRLRLVDERLGDKLILADVSPGKVGSQVIHRRTALKLIAAGSVLPLAACEKVESDNRPASVAPTNTEASPEPAAVVGRVSPLGGMHWQTSDPFLFCAHHLDDYPRGTASLGPAASLDGRHLGRDFEGRDNWRMYHGREVPGFPRHPHRGFETVTVVRTGMLDHSDSMGATARYGGGDVQWLTAGGGIQHAEMFPLLQTEAPNPLELFQIWLNLPAKSKMVPPHFTMLWSEQIPRVAVEDDAGRLVQLTISAGHYDEQRPPAPPPNSWASDPTSDLAIWSIRMEPQATFELPAVNLGTNRSLYFHRGSQIIVGDQSVGPKQRIELAGHGAIRLQAGGDETELLLLQGRPIGEPVAKRGPFVMNTQDEIRQAYADYQATQFGGWPWRRNDPVHEGSKGRFAKNIDGSFEEPT